MRTLQFSYFALKSTTTSAAEMTARIGAEPDEVLVLGSRGAPPHCHAWKIVRRRAESVDDQIQHLVERLTPVHAALVELVNDPAIIPIMQVVRYFGHEDGFEDPRPLGWGLSPEVLAFLTAVKAHLDVDEYDWS
ncbi:DUF4279 domain-containing protein [Allokutzneria sp. NRRL B-24872]|uniref:DUF4279 domain-containing protein n=1 Tax=Allokutzneria sp. NRRL B-24872 TaxID=1137961 RepID=UPI000A3904BD|nr:DUF4279 domain-containing protein [Allokutzneria sp. NRRL B-24872]